MLQEPMKSAPFVEAENVPVVTTIMGKGAIPTTHPLYVGNCGMHGKYAATRQSVSVIYFFNRYTI